MRSWHHAPSHSVTDAGTYIVTAATYRRALLFDESSLLDYLQDNLFQVAREFGWTLDAWALFPNHYHFVGHCGKDGPRLDQLTGKLHANTARYLNALQNAHGRKVWHNYFEARLTYQRSFLARLRYVHLNPVKHGLVKDAKTYRWSSARWFEEHAGNAFHSEIMGLKTDQITIKDSFDQHLDTWYCKLL